MVEGVDQSYPALGVVVEQPYLALEAEEAHQALAVAAGHPALAAAVAQPCLKLGAEVEHLAWGVGEVVQEHCLAWAEAVAAVAPHSCL